MYIKPPSTTPYSIRQLRIDNPDTSFPAEPSNELLAGWGVYPVKPMTPPVHDKSSQVATPSTPQCIEGEWFQGWEIRDKTSDELAHDIVTAQSEFIDALEAHYDAVAQTKRYDNRLTCALRAGYPGPFQSEGIAFAIWMDECNAYAYEVMNQVLSGRRGMPTIEGLIAELPSIDWPIAV